MVRQDNHKEKQTAVKHLRASDACGGFPRNTEVRKRAGIKKGNLPRFPIFINLKSNTMKNTVQIYGFYVMQHIKTKKNALRFALFNL